MLLPSAEIKSNDLGLPDSGLLRGDWKVDTRSPFHGLQGDTGLKLKIHFHLVLRFTEMTGCMFGWINLFPCRDIENSTPVALPFP